MSLQQREQEQIPTPTPGYRDHDSRKFSLSFLIAFLQLCAAFVDPGEQDVSSRVCAEFIALLLGDSAHLSFAPQSLCCAGSSPKVSVVATLLPSGLVFF